MPGRTQTSTYISSLAPPHFSDKLKKICAEFEDVLVSDLEADQQIQCPPMEVELVPGTKPFYARRPWKNPLHCADKTKKDVQKLLKAGIIERMPSNEQAAWISLAGFIAKGEKEEKIEVNM